jgi:F0F1-type ATP synthase membrane subunit c/vacuolar-type H+-ATPase subunit K
MKTSTFERAMVQNAYTTPLRHEQLGHACTTPHSHQMGATYHSHAGTAIGVALIAASIGRALLHAPAGRLTEKNPSRNKFIRNVGFLTAAFAAGGAAQRY